MIATIRLEINQSLFSGPGDVNSSRGNWEYRESKINLKCPELKPYSEPFVPGLV